MIQFNTNATKITSRWMMRAVSRALNVVSSEGMEQRKAMMLRNVTIVV